MKRIILIAVVTAACGLAAVAWVYFRQPDAVSLPAVQLAPAVDLAALKAKAAQGDAQAQARLGKAFAQGEGAPQDYKQAAHWYGQAASNGNAEAEAALGELCQAGQGVPRDLTNAVQWFTKAAEGGSTAAQYDLGFLYEQGQGVPHNEHLAAHWYQLAAEGGDALAQFDFGQRCLLGVGVAPDPVEGLKWLLLAGAQGQKDAQTKAESVQKNMTGAQIAEAKHRAAAFTNRPVSSTNKT
jgi:TPR repeat protein